VVSVQALAEDLMKKIEHQVMTQECDVEDLLQHSLTDLMERFAAASEKLPIGQLLGVDEATLGMLFVLTKLYIKYAYDEEFVGIEDEGGRITFLFNKFRESMS
jgi:hypothetical protein